MLRRIEHSHAHRAPAPSAPTDSELPQSRRKFAGETGLKTDPSQLAINGGIPAFLQPLHVGRPNVPTRDQLLSRINDILDNEWLTNDGPYVHEFESRVASITGVRNCIATSSGTSALEILGAALELTGEVIVPAMTFIATPHAFAWRGLTPVFADIDPKTCCICPIQVEKLISPKTSAIVGVHLWGHPCETDALAAIAQQYELKLIYDSSHAFGCSHQGQMIGNFGEAEVFSFHATKFVAAGEGGAVVTNNDQLADRLRRIRSFGFTDIDQVGMVGTNAKLNEISAAFGITSLNEMDSFVNSNERTHDHYAQKLAEIPGIRLREFQQGEQHNYQYVVAHIDEAVTGVSRDELLRMLHAENVLARRYFYPGCHRSAPYGSLEVPCTSLPVTDRVASDVLCLPAGRSVSEAAVNSICRMIELFTTPTRDSNTPRPSGIRTNEPLAKMPLRSA